MTKRDVYSLTFRILGILALFNIIRFISTTGEMVYMYSIQSLGNKLSILYYLAPSIASLLLYFILAFILLTRADILTIKIVKEDMQIPTIIGGENSKEIFILSLKIMGVLFMVKGGVLILEKIVEVFLKAFSSGGVYMGIFDIYKLSTIFYSLCLISVGVYFLSGGIHLVDFAFRKSDK